MSRWCLVLKVIPQGPLNSPFAEPSCPVPSLNCWFNGRCLNGYWLDWWIHWLQIEDKNQFKIIPSQVQSNSPSPPTMVCLAFLLVVEHAFVAWNVETCLRRWKWRWNVCCLCCLCCLFVLFVLFVCLFVCAVCLSVCVVLFVCLFVCLFVLFVCLFVLFVCLCCLFVCLYCLCCLFCLCCLLFVCLFCLVVVVVGLLSTSLRWFWALACFLTLP